jgi:hypothetical protein
MKLLIIVSFLSLTGTVLFGQNVTIPDANFKAYLVGNTAINTNADTEIQVTEAQAYSGSINCPNLNISDLTGIEYFTAITNLNCTDNQLTTLDVSNNVALTHLSVYNNDLTNLDVSQISSLTRLWCMFNPLTTIDVSQNSNLIFLQANNCLLNSVNLANGNNTNFISAVLNNNSNLTCITVDDEIYSTTNWTSNDFAKDAGASYSENCGGTAGIIDIQQNRISLFPNPTNHQLNISLSEASLVIISDINGKQILTSGSSMIHQVDVSILQSGIYLIQTENGAMTRFIKQ